jgi:hypothetical protein
MVQMIINKIIIIIMINYLNNKIVILKIKNVIKLIELILLEKINNQMTKLIFQIFLTISIKH